MCFKPCWYVDSITALLPTSGKSKSDNHGGKNWLDD
jgi:hypothetical protein